MPCKASLPGEAKRVRAYVAGRVRSYRTQVDTNQSGSETCASRMPARGAIGSHPTNCVVTMKSRASALPQPKTSIHPHNHIARLAHLVIDVVKKLRQPRFVNPRRNRKIGDADALARIQHEHLPRIVFASDVEHETVVDVEFHPAIVARMLASGFSWRRRVRSYRTQIGTNKRGPGKCASRVQLRGAIGSHPTQMRPGLDSKESSTWIGSNMERRTTRNE